MATDKRKTSVNWGTLTTTPDVVRRVWKGSGWEVEEDVNTFVTKDIIRGKRDLTYLTGTKGEV